MAINFPNTPANDETFTQGNTTWQWDGTAWSIVGNTSAVSIPNNFGTISVAGQDDIVADTNSDTLTFVAGSNVTLVTNPAGDAITINSTGGGGGGGDTNQNAFSVVSVLGQNNVEADSVTDTLSLVAGTGIILTTNQASDSVTITASAGVTSFGTLTDIQAASIDVHDVYEHAIATLRMGNIGTSAYTINSHYSGNNPTITVLTGTTIAFDLDDIGGHPFELQDNTLTGLTSNLAHVAADGTVSLDSNAQGKSSGMLYWRVADNLTNNTTYVYQCTSHSAMFGSMKIKNMDNI